MLKRFYADFPSERKCASYLSRAPSSDFHCYLGGPAGPCEPFRVR